MEDKPQALDWRDDILYREQSPPVVGSATKYTVQVVSVDDSEAHDLKSYPSADTAHRKKALIDDDLRDLTRSQFLAKYGMPENQARRS